MNAEGRARTGRKVGVPPVWTSILAVIAHPDDASVGLGTVLDAFVVAGTRVEVLCLTHRQMWTLQGAPGDLAALRGAELASAADVLGPFRAEMLDGPDGELREVDQTTMVAEVVAAAESCLPDGLLVLDTTETTGHVDHVVASSAAQLAARTINLPVLGWAFSDTVASQLKQQFGTVLSGHQDTEIDLRVSLERARQRVASHNFQGRRLPGRAQRRRLELLADTRCLRWLRPPGFAGSDDIAPVPPAKKMPREGGP